MSRRQLIPCAATVIAAAMALTASPASARCLILSQTNSGSNEVLVYRVQGDGGLRLADRVSTGGSGNSGLLHSSNSIATAGGDAAFVVNAKSDTVTSFALTGRTITKVGSFPSGGTTPKSLWVHGDRLYVLNAGTPIINHDTPTTRVAPAVIRAFDLDGTRATRVPNFKVTLPDTCRSYPCDATAAYAQVAVTPDATAVVVSDTDNDQMVVARLHADGRTGRARAFESGTPHPYGFTVTDGGLFVVSGTRASGNGVTGTGRVEAGRWRTITKGVGSRGGASCWLVLSHDQKYVYVSDFGGTKRAALTSVRLTRTGKAKIVGSDQLPGTIESGPLDVSIDPRDRYAYATTTDGVYTFRIRDHVARYAPAKSISVSSPGPGTIGSGMLPLPDPRGLG